MTDEKLSSTRKVAAVAHEAIDGAASKVEPIEQQIREQSEKVSGQLDATQVAATETVEQTMKKVENFVRERPIAATGIAFAAGALIALILKR